MFVYKQPNKNFTIIPNDVINCEKISLNALALYVKLRSKAKWWKFSATQIAKECQITIKTFYKYMKELYDEGLIQRVQLKDDSGRFGNEVAYVFHDSEIQEVEINLESLSKEQVKSLQEATLKQIQEAEQRVLAKQEELEECSKLESSDSSGKKTDFPNFTTLNNNIDSNKTKKDIAPSYAFINLAKLLTTCKAALQEKAKKRQEAKEAQRQEEQAFLNRLRPDDAIAYQEFIRYRSEKKKLSKATITRIQNKFLKLIAQGQNMPEIVETSITRGWSDVFAKKELNAYKSPQTKRNKPKSDTNEPQLMQIDYEAEWAKMMADM